MQDRLKFIDYMCLLLVVILALGVRAAYLHWAVDDGKGKPAWRVQDGPVSLQGQRPADHESIELNKLAENWHDHAEFKGPAPLARDEEITGHVAPGYSWVLGQAQRLNLDVEQVMRWGQAGLGTLTVLCYFLFARRAFGSLRVALVAGLCGAVHPFWIISTAELQDGVLATFALAVVLALGARGSQAGGVLTGLVFGLCLAGLVLVRAAFLPFALVALIWYLLSCRKQRLGWLCALLACLGFATGLNPWIIRDYQAFGEPVPVVTSTFLHLWMGNCPQARGAELDEAQLKNSFADSARYKELLDETNQARRYNMLAHDVVESVRSDPKGTCDRRVQAGLAFLLGRSWFMDDVQPDKPLWLVDPSTNKSYNHALADPVHPPDWLPNSEAQAILIGTLLALFFLGFIGWRVSMNRRQQSRLAALAVFWVPLPYILSHAEMLSGPRLPLDGVLLCLAAYALVGFEGKKKS